MASEEREERLLDAPILTFNINHQIERLKSEEQWSAEDRNGITLIKNDHLCLVLIVLKKGAQIVRHELEGPCAIQVLSGTIRVEAENATYEVATNSVTIFEEKLEHMVEAVEESAMLVTIIYDQSED